MGGATTPKIKKTFCLKIRARSVSECALSHRAKLPKNAKLAERIGGVATHSLRSKVAKAHHNATHSPCSWVWCAKKLVKVRTAGAIYRFVFENLDIYFFKLIFNIFLGVR